MVGCDAPVSYTHLDVYKRQVIFFIVAFFVGKAAGVVFQDLGARVAQGVHRVAHAVNQAAAVTLSLIHI